MGLLSHGQLERMSDALEDYISTVSVGSRTVSNLRFADDIDGLAGSEKELSELTRRLNKSSGAYGMGISAEKTKEMTSSKSWSYCIRERIQMRNVSQDSQIIAALTKLRPILKDGNISITSKIRLWRSLVLAIFLYACKT